VKVAMDPPNGCLLNIDKFPQECFKNCVKASDLAKNVTATATVERKGNCASKASASAGHPTALTQTEQ